MSNRKLSLRYISPKTFTAIVATSNGHFYISKFPYNSLTKCESIDKKPISKTFNESDIHSIVFPRAMLIALSEMNDLFVKINNGSIDILDDEHYKELMLEKIKNNIFLLKGEGRPTIIQWLSLSFMLIDYDKNDVDEITDAIESAGHSGSFVSLIYRRFGRYKKDSLVNKIMDKEISKMISEGKWSAFRQAAFVLYFMAKCYSKDRSAEAKKTYDESIEEFEKKTGMDANYSRLQRHTDRFTRNQHFNGKRSKKKTATP